jgi:hypothetical protein
MILSEHRLIFVHIQKTGGNAITMGLGQWPGDPMKHFTALELRRVTGETVWEESFKFAFVRNPWDRLVSWWSMVNALRGDYLAGRPLNRFQSTVLSKTSCFEDFVGLDDVIVDTDGTKCVQRNQIDYICDENGKVIVDFVGRFERLQEDVNLALADRLGKKLTLPHANSSVRKDFRSYYTPALAEKVARIFERDIAAFGYSFDG